MSVREYLKKVRLDINKLGSKKRYGMLKIKNPTIISNNCWGGIVSQYLGIKYHTPTIGLYFFADEYIKFLKKFDHYIKQNLTFISPKESKYYNELLIKKHENSLIGKLDDVEIVFLHYRDKDDLKKKWKRRVERINFNCLIFKFNDQNLCTEKNIKEFDELDLKNKLCFTSKPYPQYKSVIWIKEDKNKKEVQKDYYKSHKYLNMIEYINNI